MTRTERRAHLWAWVALAPVLVALVILAVLGRKQVPVQASPAAAVREPSR